MQVVQALHVYTMMWLMCENVHIYQTILEYSFDVVASWDISKNIQSTSNECVKKFPWIFQRYCFLFMFICSCSHSHNSIHVLHTNMLQSQKSCYPMILVNFIDLWFKLLFFSLIASSIITPKRTLGTTLKCPKYAISL